MTEAREEHDVTMDTGERGDGADRVTEEAGASAVPGDTPVVEGAEADEPASPGEIVDVAAEFVGGLLAAMEIDAAVSTRVEGDTAHVDISGDGLGVLIGRRGQTLDALQEVARTAVQRRVRARVRLLVDVEGYRARRRESLAEYARAMAERAKSRGTEIELEPMNAYERKIVHDAVAAVDGATSFSEGEEPNRKVVVRAS